MRRYGWKVLVLFILAGAVFVWLIKAPLIASYLTDKLKVNVSIGSISIWPSETSMMNFRINNPRGFKDRAALKVDTTKVQYNLKHLVGKPSEIDYIELDGVLLRVEFSNPMGSSNNWTAIAAKMPKSKNEREVIVHKLVVTNLDIEIRGLGLVGVPSKKHVDRLEINEISSTEGFPTKEVISQIFGGAGIQQFIKDAFNPQNLLQKVLPFKGFGSENEQVKENTSNIP